METIYDSFEDFDLKEIKINNPISKAGGYHILKFSINNSPLYIQPKKCMTKNGINVGKKSYCDLLFSTDDQEFLTWLESLESHCQNYIYENRNKWFEGSLELDDIESYFISPTKFYKSGKFYLVRVNIPTLLGKPSLKIYDESENEVNISNIDENTEITSILEFKGVKCSARSFQIDIEVKQMMKMEPIQLFSKCLIKKKNVLPNDSHKLNLQKTNDDQEELELENNVDLSESDESENDLLTIENNAIELAKNDNDGTSSENENIFIDELSNTLETDISDNDISVDKNLDFQNDSNSPKKKEEEQEKDTNYLGTSNEELIVDTDNSLQEINLDESILESSDVIEIKEANEVYYKMYKEAIKRAKMARDLALTSYLEAKNIKNKYMLDQALCESDDSDLEKELDS